MNYTMKATIYKPEDSTKTRTLTVDCHFEKEEDGYGKKYWLSLDFGTSDITADLRYDRSFHPDKLEVWLADWAYGYWCGKDGAWAVKSLTITKEG